jgi:hypothetical protein
LEAARQHQVEHYDLHWATGCNECRFLASLEQAAEA